MAEVNPPLHLQARTDHTAVGDRSLLETLFMQQGVAEAAHLAVTQNGTPNMSVNVAAGRVVIDGTENSLQGYYHCTNDATKNLVIAAADATNPRIDLVVAKVEDASYSGVTNAWSLAVVTGTPAASPAAPSAPANSITLAQISVPALDTTIGTAQITDTRTRCAALGGTTVCTAATRPASPTAGDRIYETDTQREYMYSGSGWVEVGQVTATGIRTYTPALAQGATPTVVVNEASYVRRGNTVEAWVHLQGGATSGTAGTVLSCTLPVNCSLTNTSATHGALIGSGYVYDNGTGVRYVCNIMLSAAGTVVFSPDGTHGSCWGVTPNLAFNGANDRCGFHVSYPV